MRACEGLDLVLALGPGLVAFVHLETGDCGEGLLESKSRFFLYQEFPWGQDLPLSKSKLKKVRTCNLVVGGW